jgi:hypothetical protein
MEHFQVFGLPTQKTEHDLIYSLNDIVGPPESLLDADETDVVKKIFY